MGVTGEKDRGGVPRRNGAANGEAELPIDFQQLWLQATGALPSLHGAPESLPVPVVPGLGDGFKYWGDAPLAVDLRALRRLTFQELVSLEHFLGTRTDLYDAQAALMEASEPLRGRASRLWVNALEALREQAEMEINSRLGGFFYQDVDG